MADYEFDRDFDPMRDFDPARDFDPTEDFDPMRDYVRHEVIRTVARTWATATGEERPTGDSPIGDIDQGAFLGLLLTLEDLTGAPLMAAMHEFTGKTVDDFVTFVVDHIPL
ncbi:hypothetical protein [Nonomuraea sp. 10N515B]|uniref:hypothetical protein n=1 Tax=Nonomuraea sp. 10N515B TaxID=3457422 RepID=UPI003FCCAE53